MKKLYGILVIIVCVNNCLSQDNVLINLKSTTSRTIKKEVDTTTWNWKKGGLLSFNLSQGSLSNWAAGGDNFTLSINAYFNYYFFYKNGRRSWDNNLEANLGYVQATSIGGRKNDDRFDFLSKYGYKMDSVGKWYITGLFNFRSQFFDGNTYSNNVGVFSSSFLSPAYLFLSVGLEYKGSDKFSIFISPVTARSTFVTNGILAKKGGYGIPAGKMGILQLGAFTTLNYYKGIGKNIIYKGRLDMFSNYQLNPENIDIFMTNLFSFKINKNFSATYSLDMIYDDDIRLFGELKNSAGLQVKSLIGIGFLQSLNIKRTRIN